MKIHILDVETFDRNILASVKKYISDKYRNAEIIVVERNFKSDIWYSFRDCKSVSEAIDLYTYMKIITDSKKDEDVMIVECFAPLNEMSLNVCDVMWYGEEQLYGCSISSEVVDKIKRRCLLEPTISKHLLNFLDVSAVKGAKFIKNHEDFKEVYERMLVSKRNFRKSPIKLCLCMIVKNEGKIITRAFDSIVKHLDYWIICDTGSTDDTRDIIKNYFKERGIPGYLMEEKWKNFGHNRTLVVQEASRNLFNQNYYLLLMDADFEMKVIDPDFKSKLNPQVDDFILQYEGSLDYYRSLIISADWNWLYKHGTHEYLTSYDRTVNQKNHMVKIYEHPDGGCKSDKFQRDINILKEEIEDDVKNGRNPEARCYFYIGQSYECINDYDNAIKYYKDVGNQNNAWAEEVYIGLTRVGDNMLKKGEPFENVCGHWMRAYGYRPHRLEALNRIVSHYQKKERYNEGYSYGSSYKQFYKGYPSDILFIDRNIHNFEFWDCFSVCCYYVGNHKEALNVINTLLANHSKVEHIPNYQLTRVINNGRYSSDRIIDKTTLIAPVKLSSLIGSNISTIKFDKKLFKNIDKRFNLSSPSIVKRKDENGYLINIRLVNYTINEQQAWKYKYEGNITTQNVLCWTDDNMNIQTYSVINDGIFKFKYSCGIDGLEDIRLFWVKNNLYFTATSLQVRQDCQKCMIVGRLNINDKMNVYLEYYDILDNYRGNEAQKNWAVLPYDEVKNDGKIRFIYSFCPFTIISYDIETEEQKVDRIRFSIPTNWRGSTQCIPYKDGYLALVHTSNFPKYSHTFIYFSLKDNCNNGIYGGQEHIQRWSSPFFFESYQIEFTCGMTYDNDDRTKIILPYSVCDNDAGFIVLNVTDIDKMLCYS
jgi:tetratricopeptide (TPR) repeat protein